MANTLGDLKARVAAELLRSDQSANIANAIGRAIEFWAPRRFWFNEDRQTTVTAPGNEYATYPTGLRVDDALFVTVNGSGYPLHKRSNRWIEAAAQAVNSSAQPTDYAMVNGQVRLYPKPNLVYVVTAVGVFDEPALGSDAASNSWTAEAQDLISARARMTLCRDILRDPDMAQAAAQAEQEALMRLIAETTRRTATSRGSNPQTRDHSMIKPLALAAIAAAGLCLPASAQNSITGKTGTCDPAVAANCIKPNADGSVNVSGSITASNPSVGPTGSASPGSGTLVAGDNGGVVKALSVDASGRPTVNINGPAGIKGLDGSAIAAGSNPVPVVLAPALASGGAITPVVSTAVEACHVLKASASALYGFTVTTTGSAGATDWILVLNASSAPGNGAVTPVEWGRVGANGQYAWSAPGGVPQAFSTGVVVCLSTAGPFTLTADAQAVISGKIQ
jgi:hypothetical protein